MGKKLDAAIILAAKIKALKQSEQELLALAEAVEPKMTKAQKETLRVAKERRNGR